MTALSPMLFLQAIQGTQISYVDWLQQYASVVGTSGYGVAFQQGTQNAVPQLQPLAVTATGGMGVSIGGSLSLPQFVLTQALLCGVPTASAFTVPNNATGSTRIDGIAIQPVQITNSTVQREVEASDGTKTMEAIPIVYYGLNVQYITGPSGGGQPTAPSGFTMFATISVPNGAGSITQGEITVLFPTMNGTGSPGPAGPAGTNGHGSTTLTAAATMPAAGSSVTVDVVDATAFAPYGYALCGNGTDAFVGEVTASSTGSVTILCSAILAGTAGDTLPIGTVLTFSGIPGASGHGVSYNVNSFTIPEVLSSVTFTVADVTPYAEGSWGYAIGPLGENAMVFVVTSIAGNALTVNNMGFLAPNVGGGVGTVFDANGTIIACGPSTGFAAFLTQPVAQSITPGSSYTLHTSNNTPFPVGTMLIIYGMSGFGDISVFRVTNQATDGTTLTATNIYANNGGAGLGRYATIAPCPLFGAIAPAQHTYAPTVGTIVNAGTVPNPGVGGTQTITFTVPFSDANYIITVTPHDGNYSVNVPAADRTATGCSVVLSGTGSGESDYIAVGY